MNTSSDPSPRSDSAPRPESCENDDENLAKRRSNGETDCSPNGAASTANGSADSRFSCNICFDEVTEPVVTRCGHLYSWPCLFQWLEPGMTREERESLGLSSFRYGGRNPNRRVCPVCKAVCPLSGIVPLYIQSPPTSCSRSKSSAKTSPTKEMVESNEMDPHEPENDVRSNGPESSRIEVTNEGLRRRRANTIPNDLDNNDSEPMAVPNRPSVAHPQHHEREPTSPTMSRRSSPGSSPRTRASTDNPYRAGAVQLTPRSPNGHNGSLTYGILSSLQRATAEYYRNNQTSNADESDRRIPSLHDRRNPMSNHNADGGSRFADYPQGYAQYDDGNGSLNSETTQYLTRLLIMLTSFVIFCFLAV